MLNVQEGNEWVKIARAAASSGLLQQASNALVHAESLGAEDIVVEKAHV